MGSRSHAYMGQQGSSMLLSVASTSAYKQLRRERLILCSTMSAKCQCTCIRAAGRQQGHRCHSNIKSHGFANPP